MTDCHAARRQPVRAHDRHVLAAAYWPVIAFAAVLITARIRRHQRQAAPR